MKPTLQDQPTPTQEERSQPVALRCAIYAKTVLNDEATMRRFHIELGRRHELGLERYGTGLMSYNGRDALVDAAQEALDGCQYLTQAWMECEDFRVGALEDLLKKQIEIASDILALIEEREV